MIWHEIDISLPGTPPDTTLKLLGIYNNPGTDKPLIEIVLRTTGDTTKDVVIASKDPSLLAIPDDPNPKDVFTKYRTFFNKILAKLQSREKYKPDLEV